MTIETCEQSVTVFAGKPHIVSMIDDVLNRKSTLIRALTQEKYPQFTFHRNPIPDAASIATQEGKSTIQTSSNMLAIYNGAVGESTQTKECFDNGVNLVVPVLQTSEGNFKLATNR